MGRRHPRLSSSTASGVLAAVLIAAVVAGYTYRQRRFGPVEAAHALRELTDRQEDAGVLLLDPGVDTAGRDEGIAACRKALARFGVLDSPAWLSTSPAADLGADDRADLRERVGSLLMLWARALARHPPDRDPVRRAEGVNAALRYNRIAETCYAPADAPRALWVQRATLLRLAGDAAGETRARERAARTPVRSPREFAMLALDDPEGGATRDALPALAEASRQSPRDFALWMYLGLCHALQGRLPDAQDCFTVAIVLRPESPWPYYHRGRVGVDRGKFGQARLDLDQAVRLRPGLAAAYVNRALARSGEGDLRGAVADLTEALDRGATETRVYFIRADVRTRSGDHAGADRDLAEALRRTPADAESWVARGLARLTADPAGALADFEEALALDPRSRSALENKAVVLSERFGRAAEAVAVLDRAVASYPDYVPARAGRGVLLARLGRREAAHRDAEDCRVRDPSGADTAYRVACIYALTSKSRPADRSPALRMLAAALARQPSWLGVARTDPDLDALRDRDEFRDLIPAFSGRSAPGG